MAGEPIFDDDPYGGIKKEKGDPNLNSREVSAIHTNDDVDGSVVAHHHTLGINRNQASPGSHLHDGTTSKKLMVGITITGSKGGNAALADLITKLATALGFTDGTT